MEELINKNNTASEEQKELFIAALAHDLKNPLTAQLAALEQFYKGKFGGINIVQKEVLSDIINSYKYMTDMLSSLLSVYKFENGTAKINKTQVNIEGIIQTCIKEITPAADEKCITIEFINKTRTCSILCDENCIRRAAANMLNNIVLYSYKNTKASVILEKDETSVFIRFKSCGIPIKEEFKAHIFDKYNSGFHNNAGTGLGLYFCKCAAEAHGGNITLITKNSNAEFCIKLPEKAPKNAVLKLI